jgi:hypothetical protein
LAKANALLKAKDEKYGNLFNRILDLNVRFRDAVQEAFPDRLGPHRADAEAVPLEDFAPNGTAGKKLDNHDILGGMLKNRTDQALFVDSGAPSGDRRPDGRRPGGALGRVEVETAVLPEAEVEAAPQESQPSEFGPRLVLEKSAALEEIYTEIYDRHPTFFEDKVNYGKLVDVLAKKILATWKADEDRFRPGFKVPSIYIDDVMATLYGALSRTGRLELLEGLKADDRKREDPPGFVRLPGRLLKRTEKMMTALPE